MLAIFDVDGTIIDSQGVEGECYAAAIAAVSGHEIPTDDWARFAEPTSSGIVRELLAGHPRSAAMEDEIRQDFVRRLHEAQPRFPAEFSGSGASPVFSKLCDGPEFRSRSRRAVFATKPRSSSSAVDGGSTIFPTRLRVTRRDGEIL